MKFFGIIGEYVFICIYNIACAVVCVLLHGRLLLVPHSMLSKLNNN